MIVNGDIITGVSSYKVDIFDKNNTLRGTVPFPKEEAFYSIGFYTYNEAIAAFKQYYGVKNTEDRFFKNLKNEDVFSQFTTDDGTTYQFVKISTIPILDPKLKK